MWRFFFFFVILFLVRAGSSPAVTGEDSVIACPRPRKGLAALLVALLAVVISGMPSSAATAVDIFYYCPDSPQRNLGGLKQQMETVLNRLEFAANFQPFAHYVDFDQAVRAKRPPFLFLPFWYFQLYGEKLGLRPLLTPQYNGSPTYRKELLVRKGASISLGAVSGRSLAMTSMGPDDELTLNAILFSAHQADAKTFSIVTVPKDADALFALALGHVDMALVGKQSMALIGAINPKIIQSVQPLAESQPIPGPILCYAPERVPSATAEHLKRVLQQADKDNNVLEILQIDGWMAVGQ